MIRQYIILEIIGEILKQYTMNESEIELTKIELNYKSTRELENLLEKLQEENQ
jgi:hypothetical protein